jgi:hypothetical protein
MASRSGKPNRVGGAPPATAGALIELARQQSRDGRRAEAEATLRRVIDDNPKNREALFLLAEVQRALGKRNDAVVTLRAIAGDSADAAAHYQLGVVLREASRLAEAEFVLRDAIASRARRQHFPSDGRCPRVAFLERLRAPEIPRCRRSHLRD